MAKRLRTSTAKGKFDLIIAQRVSDARRRDDNPPRRPAPERLRSIGLERVVCGESVNDHDRDSKPMSGDIARPEQQPADDAAAIKVARGFFDRLAEQAALTVGSAPDAVPMTDRA